MDDDLTVLRQPHVELQTVGAERQAVVERRQGILRPRLRTAAVRIDEGTRHRGNLTSDGTRDSGLGARGSALRGSRFRVQGAGFKVRFDGSWFGSKVTVGVSRSGKREAEATVTSADG